MKGLGFLDDRFRCGSNLDRRTAFDIVEGLLKLNKRIYHLNMNIYCASTPTMCFT
jgi:hypothetical protein